MNKARRRRTTRAVTAGILLTLALLCLHGASAAQEDASDVLLRATFEKGLPATFERLGGQWQAHDGILRQDASDGTSLLVTGKPTWDDYTVRTRVRLSSSAGLHAEAGLIFHVRDGKNYLAFALRRKEGGSYAVLRIEVNPGMKIVGDQARRPISLSDWHELKADVHGVEIYCYLDGAPIVNFNFSGTPPSYNSHGRTWPEDLSRGRLGFITENTQADFEGLEVTRLHDFAHIVTPQKGTRDRYWRLLPRQSYAETMRSFTEWMLDSDNVVNKDDAPPAVRNLPAYLLTNWNLVNDHLLIGGDVEFAFVHALFISGAVQYYMFNGDRRPLEMAAKLADWHISNSTPQSYALPYLPPSWVQWQPDGTWKGQEHGLEPDKSAYMGTSYLKLYAVTGQKKYLDAATRLAGTLGKLQQADGSFPFRVDPRTGEVRHGYTCSQLWYVWFFERLAAATGDRSYLQPRDGAFRWLLDNPVRTNRWLGLYGDIASGAESYDQWVPLETAMYLIEHRGESPRYLDQAQEILDWVNRTLVVDYGLHPGVPGVLEQSQYRVVLTWHELRLGEIYAKLWEATGDVRYKDLAVQIANSVTWCLMSDGKMREGFWFHAWAVPMMISYNDQFCRIMAAIPETAPKGENHLLQTTSYVRQVSYSNQKIQYRTQEGSLDALAVKGPPTSVTAGGRALQRLKIRPRKTDGWTYEAKTNLLRVNHRSPDVTIMF